jgi:cytoskeletal protein CcmA (bactofilin family)
MKEKSKNISIIDRGLTLEGSVSCSGRLVVKGVVRGDLRGDDVVIAEEGSVQADADVAVITIGGTFEGTLNVSRKMVVLSTGNCSGKITCNDMVVESGAVLNAAVQCTKGG